MDDLTSFNRSDAPGVMDGVPPYATGSSLALEGSLPHDDFGPQINLTIWFLVDAILGQRIYSKFLHHRPLWWDDYVLISAWVNSDSGEGSATPKRTGESVQASIIAASVLATVPTVFGYGRHSWDVAPADLTRGW